MKARVLAVIIGISLTALAAPGDAQVRYLDASGGVHWVQSEAQVPAQYRSRPGARQPASPPAGDRSIPSPSTARPAPTDIRTRSAAGSMETPVADTESLPSLPVAQTPPVPRMIPLFSPWGYQ
jgi:hypothetical protein